MGAVESEKLNGMPCRAEHRGQRLRSLKWQNRILPTMADGEFQRRMLLSQSGPVFLGNQVAAPYQHPHPPIREDAVLHPSSA